MRILQPAGWPRPSGYANGVSAYGRTIFTAGIVAWDEQQRIVAPDLPGQLRQVLANTLTILAEDAAFADNIVRMTWYVTDLDEYRSSLAEIGAVWRELMGLNYPAMAVIGVAALIDPEAKIEIETVAVAPEDV